MFGVHFCNWLADLEPVVFLFFVEIGQKDILASMVVIRNICTKWRITKNIFEIRSDVKNMVIYYNTNAQTVIFLLMLLICYCLLSFLVCQRIMKYKEQTPSSKGNHAAVLLCCWPSEKLIWTGTCSMLLAGTFTMARFTRSFPMSCNNISLTHWLQGAFCTLYWPARCY